MISLVEGGARFIRNVSLTSIAVARIIAESVTEKIRFRKFTGEKLIVLGTGPSLKRSLGQLTQIAPGSAVFLSVNDYFKEDSFRLLKPALHVIADPIYWDNACFVGYAEPLIAGIGDIDWPLMLFLPFRAKGSKLHAALSSRAVPFTFYNTTPIGGFPTFEYYAFSQMLGMPKAQNVLVPAIAVALWLDFNAVCLVGADHSWHQEIEVDQQNTLMVRQVHSYDGRAETRPFYKPSGVGKLASKMSLEKTDTFSVKEILRAWATMHESYENLDRIARRMRARVVNASAVSFIDAFERTGIQEFLSDVSLRAVGQTEQ